MRYVVALFLLQRKRLKLDGTRHDDGQDLLVFLGSRGEGPYEVVDQQLTADEMSVLEAEMKAQLQSQREQVA